MHLTAVIDNATLVNLTRLKHLNIFNSLRSIFSQIHIPLEVRKEYEVQVSKEPDRVWVLERLRPDRGFYLACDRYDSIVLAVISGVRDIDKGEAEAVAQYRKVNSHYILSDDLNFKEAISRFDKTIKVLTTLHIIAMLDIRQLLVNPEEIVRTHHAFHRFNSSSLRMAYSESALELGISINKKTLNTKCSFKKLGLK